MQSGGPGDGHPSTRPRHLAAHLAAHIAAHIAARLATLLAAGVLVVATSACAGGDTSPSSGPSPTPPGAETGDNDTTDTGAAAGTDTAGNDTAGADGDEPSLADLDACGGPDHPCSWADAAEGVLEQSMAIGEAAIATYVETDDLFAAAEQIVASPEVADLFMSANAIVYRVSGGFPMWVLADSAFDTRGGAPEPLPATARRVHRPALPRDVVGDDPEQKRALVLAPYLFEFGQTDESAEVAALYQGARGYAGGVDLFVNSRTEQQIGDEQFQNWDLYDVIHIATHGQQICDGDTCTTVLLGSPVVDTVEQLADGTTITFSSLSTVKSYSDRFFAAQYPEGLPDTVVVIAACETAKGTELTSAIGGVTFSWTEPVRSDFARESALGLHSELIEYGTTSSSAFRELEQQGLTSYLETEPDLEWSGVLAIGKKGVLERVDRQPEPVTVQLVNRVVGDDLRVREVAWIDHPRQGRPMQSGDRVRVSIRTDGDYLPVSLRVDGIDDGAESSTVLRLYVDEVELGSWTAAEGTQTGTRGQWSVDTEVRLQERVSRDDEIDMRLEIDLPEGGTSEHTVRPVHLDCLPGVWRLRSQEFLDEITASIGAVGALTYRSGEYRIEIFDDGTYVGYRDQWTHALSTPQGTLVTTIDSTDPGTWNAVDERLTISEPSSSATVRLQLEIGGQLQDLPFGAGFQTVDVGAASGTGTVECGDSVLTFTTDGADGLTTTFDYVGPTQN